MADNYLEEKFEAYEAKKAAWLKKRKTGGKKASPVHGESVKEADTKDVRYDVADNEDPARD